MPLSGLLAGQSACVERVLGLADDVHRLQEFGIRDGTAIQMFRPGDPCIIRMSGNKVCLRAGDLVNVMVRPVHAAG